MEDDDVEAFNHIKATSNLNSNSQSEDMEQLLPALVAIQKRQQQSLQYMRDF